MFKINSGEELTIRGSIIGEKIIDNWEYLDKYVIESKNPVKCINIVCGEDDGYIIANHIHTKLVGNQNYIDSHIVLNFDKGIVKLYITDTSTDDIEIDKHLNISITRRNPDNVRVRVGLEFMVELDRTRIESYENDIRPAIEELIKQINSANIEGFRGINKTCWVADRHPDFNKSKLDFTL